MTRIPVKSITLMLVALTLSLAGAPAVQALAAGTSCGGVVLTPSDDQGNEITSPGYFEVSGAPGASVQLYALVGNIQSVTVKLSLVPVDATSGVYGGISYNLPKQPRKHVGAWVTLSSQGFRLPPQKARVVSIIVHIPSSAAPGQYVGGLTAYVPAPSGKSAIIVQLRRVVAIVVTVTGGPAFGRFTIGSIRPKHRPDAYYVVSHIHNTGTMLLKGQGHLWVWKSGRKKPVISAPITLDTTVPHTTVYYPVLLAKRPKPGSYSFKLTLTWDGGGAATRTGSFTIHK